MTALHDFIRAAASYYGLPQEQLTEGCTLDTSNGDMELVLRIVLSHADVVAIGKRMDVMRVEAESDARVAAQQAQQAAQEAPSDAELREAYNALSTAERSCYGSFARFKLLYVPVETVQAEQTEPVEVPTVVWLDRHEATEQQKVMAIGVDEKGRYGVDPADLTPDQVERKLHLRLEGLQ